MEKTRKLIVLFINKKKDYVYYYIYNNKIIKMKTKKIIKIMIIFLYLMIKKIYHKEMI